jgi:uncharacterized membrane protein
MVSSGNSSEMSLDNCTECIVFYSIGIIMGLFIIVYIVFRVILLYHVHTNIVLDHYNDTDIDSNTNITNGGNDIMLPKYTHFDELTEDEIQFTLPPVYNDTSN